MLLRRPLRRVGLKLIAGQAAPESFALLRINSCKESRNISTFIKYSCHTSVSTLILPQTNIVQFHFGYLSAQIRPELDMDLGGVAVEGLIYRIRCITIAAGLGAVVIGY